MTKLDPNLGQFLGWCCLDGFVACGADLETGTANGISLSSAALSVVDAWFSILLWLWVKTVFWY